MSPNTEVESYIQKGWTTQPLKESSTLTSYEKDVITTVLYECGNSDYDSIDDAKTHVLARYVMGMVDQRYNSYSGISLIPHTTDKTDGYKEVVSRSDMNTAMLYLFGRKVEGYDVC